MSRRPTLDDEDIAIIVGGLRTSYTWALDAYANCSGKPTYPDFKREQPRYKQMDVVIAHLNRIEALAVKLGYALETGRRVDVEEFVAREIEAWRESQGIRDLVEV